jgi:hypothetical protein
MKNNDSVIDGRKAEMNTVSFPMHIEGIGSISFGPSLLANWIRNLLLIIL